MIKHYIYKSCHWVNTVYVHAVTSFIYIFATRWIHATQVCVVSAYTSCMYMLLLVIHYICTCCLLKHSTRHAAFGYILLIYILSLVNATYVYAVIGYTLHISIAQSQCLHIIYPHTAFWYKCMCSLCNLTYMCYLM